jgi:hypothetical protein
LSPEEITVKTRAGRIFSQTGLRKAKMGVGVGEKSTGTLMLRPLSKPGVSNTRKHASSFSKAFSGIPGGP